MKIERARIHFFSDVFVAVARPAIFRSLFCCLKRLTVGIVLLCEGKSQERKRKGFKVTRHYKVDSR